MRHRATSTVASIAVGDASTPATPRASAAAGWAVSPVIVTRLLMVIDGVAILLAGLATAEWHMAADADDRMTGLVVALGAVLGVNCLHLLGAYTFAGLGRLISAVATAAVGWLIGLGVALLVASLFGAMAVSWFVAWFAGTLSLLVAFRVALHLQIVRWRRDGRLGGLVAVLGAGPIARRLLLSLAAHRGGDLRIAGIYDDQVDGEPPAATCLGHRIRGDTDDLVRDVRRLGITTVIVALPLSADLRLAAALNRLSVVPVDVRLCPDEFGLRLGPCTVTQVGGVTLLNVIDRPLRDWRWIAKVIEDRVLAAAILVLISPVMLLIAALIKLDSPGPVFFRQKRYGFNNQLIEVLKFRTMYHEARDDNAEQLTRRGDPRVTRVGAFLRRMSLDELPQFINVLRGEMSIVGPRPHALSAKAGRLLYQDAVRYYDSRHRMKPGITGWAQINGWRGETDTIEQIRKRVEHDLYYIENWSIGLDLQIILRTVFGGFTGRQAY